jgi:TolB-like protein
VGHFLGGVIGWWHAYEITFGRPQATALPTTAISATALSLVVLPIQNVSEDPDGEWLADALTSDLTTELGRLSGSLVISRDTAFAYRGMTVDPRSAARELGVRYVVHGTARQQGDRIRLTLALVDGESGVERWAEQKDLERSTLSSSLGDVVTQVGHILNVQLYRSAGERAARMKPSEMQAEDLAMQGWSTYFRGAVSRESLTDASRQFEASVARDGSCVRGWGGIAVVNGLLVANSWATDRSAAIKRLEQARQRLQDLDANDIHTYFANHFVALLNSDYESVFALGTAAAERFPSQPQAHFGRALAKMNLGSFDDEECVEPTKRAIRLGPRDPAVGLWNRQIGTCYFMRGQYPEAVTFARAAHQNNPNLATAPLLLAASLARSGQRDEALAVVAEILRRNPNARAADVEKLLRTSRNEHYLEGRNRWVETLRELGMP